MKVTKSKIKCHQELSEFLKKYSNEARGGAINCPLEIFKESTVFCFKNLNGDFVGGYSINKNPERYLDLLTTPEIDNLKSNHGLFCDNTFSVTHLWIDKAIKNPSDRLKLWCSMAVDVGIRFFIWGKPYVVYGAVGSGMRAVYNAHSNKHLIDKKIENGKEISIYSSTLKDVPVFISRTIRRQVGTLGSYLLGIILLGSSN